MVDFKGIPLEVGNIVVFIYDKFKKNELKEGKILRVNIKQGVHTMALVSWENPQGITVESRVSGPKVFFVKEK